MLMKTKTPNFDAMLAAVEGALGAATDLPVSVKVVLSNQRGEVLVLKDARSDWHDLPGGHVHPGEDFKDALVREVFEETGLALDAATISMDGTPEQHVLGSRPASVVWFKADAMDGDVELSDEHSGYEWVRPWNLDNYNLGVLLPKAKELALAGHQSRPVTASQSGHVFFGNQWTKFATHPAGDPAGSPKGRIKHAVLVIGGKRYRGPSHFQALMGWAAKNPKAQGLPQGALEGFETESGHFLDREQAAEYAAANQLITDRGEHAEQVERRGQLISEAITMAAIDGKLYTKDAVMAVEPIVLPPAEQSHHTTAQDAARRIWQASLDNWLNDLAADIHKAFHGAQAMDYDGVIAAAMVDSRLALTPAATGAATRAYGAALHIMADHAVAVPDGGQEEKDFAAQRADKLDKLPQAVEDKLRASLARALAGGEDARAISRRIDEGLREFQSGRLARAAATEAQVAYGAAQSKALELAGYQRKRWVTVGDDRVRDSHYLCESQGAIPASASFHNGLKYPGDPDGDISEVANCRCWLVGER